MIERRLRQLLTEDVGGSSILNGLYSNTAKSFVCGELCGGENNRLLPTSKLRKTVLGTVCKLEG